MKITPYTKPGQTGVIKGEPNDVYHATDAISNSNLSLFLTDPKRFKAILDGEIEPEKKDCYDLGSLFHCLSLEGIEAYQSQFVYESLVPQKPTKAQIEAYEKFQYVEKPTKAQSDAHTKQGRLIMQHDLFWSHHKGKQIAKAADDSTARAMRDSLFKDEDARELFEGWENAHREITMRSERTRFGFPVQVKFDYWAPNENLAVDLKSVRSLDVFSKNFEQFGYYRQAAFYCLVCELVTGTFPDFYFAAVETAAPHEVAVFKPDLKAINFGLDEVEAGLAALGRCLESGKFPKRFAGVNTLGLSRFAVERSQTRVERLRQSTCI